MTLLWKLLRSHLSVAQTVGFALAGVVGMTIVLTSVQAYRDVMPVFDAPDSFMRGDYLVLSKRVGALQTIGLGSSDFTPGELEELKGQPFVRDVGAFTPANYRVKGTVGMGGVQLSTYLFFEAVPDRFLDVASGKWKYEPGDGDIPIIIPRNYLNLYNYGFAKSQGLPQISEGIFQRVSLGIEVAGNGRVVEPSQYDPRPGVFHPLVERAVRPGRGETGIAGHRRDRPPCRCRDFGLPRRQGL
jgi:hypothetical protein